MKKIKYVLMGFVSFLIFSSTIFAYGFDVSLTSNSVVVGNSVTLTINGSSLAGKFTITSSNTGVATVSVGSVFVDNSTERITISAKSVGSTVITINPEDVTSYNGDTVSGSKTITLTVKNKPASNGTGGGGSSYKPTVKSSNSYLTSLTIDGYDIEPQFDKETLEYSVVLKEETEKIKINAQLENSNASVTGVGEFSVSEGVNNFEIVVTAENGSKRTYKLTATVVEVEPIKVTVDKEEYTIVRKRKDLPKISEYFSEKDIEINGEKIEGYYNENLDYQVVGLKNSKGLVNYYIYNKGKYTLYKEYSFNGTIVQVLDKEIDDGYKATSFSYDGDKIKSYQEVKMDLIKNTYALDNNDIVGNQFYLFYGKNVETGKEYLYQYDALEKTIQRYNIQVLDMYKNVSETYYTYLLGIILLLGIVIIIFSIILLKKGNANKRKKYVIERDNYIDQEEEMASLDEVENTYDDKDTSMEIDELPIKEDVNKKYKKKKKQFILSYFFF